MAILLLADTHFGLSRGPGFDWAMQALHVGKTTGCSGFIFAGDAVDRRFINERTHHEFTQFFTTAANFFETSLFIAGNHDVHHDFELPAGVVRAATTPESYAFPDNTIVHTAATLSDPDPRRLVPTFPKKSTKARANIGVLHTSLVGEHSKSECLPTTPFELDAHGYDAWLLAHVHQPLTVNCATPSRWIGMGTGLIFDPQDRSVHDLADVF